MTQKELILQQLLKYYPKRVKDYQSGELRITVKHIKTKNDKKNLRYLKQRASITDPKNNLIIGYDYGVLYIT